MNKRLSLVHSHLGHLGDLILELVQYSSPLLLVTVLDHGLHNARGVVPHSNNTHLTHDEGEELGWEGEEGKWWRSE